MCKLKYKTCAAIVKVNTFIITGLSTSLYLEYHPNTISICLYS